MGRGSLCGRTKPTTASLEPGRSPPSTAAAAAPRPVTRPLRSLFSSLPPLLPPRRPPSTLPPRRTRRGGGSTLHRPAGRSFVSLVVAGAGGARPRHSGGRAAPGGRAALGGRRRRYRLHAFKWFAESFGPCRRLEAVSHRLRHAPRHHDHSPAPCPVGPPARGPPSLRPSPSLPRSRRRTTRRATERGEVIQKRGRRRPAPGSGSAADCREAGGPCRLRTRPYLRLPVFGPSLPTPPPPPPPRVGPSPGPHTRFLDWSATRPEPCFSAPVPVLL